jgi:hypothetical protein
LRTGLASARPAAELGGRQHGARLPVMTDAHGRPVVASTLDDGDLPRPRLASRRHVGLSPRRFIEVLTADVGLTPKCSPVCLRFQRVLALIRLNRQIDWADVGLEHDHAAAGLAQAAGGRQAGEASPHHDNVDAGPSGRSRIGMSFPPSGGRRPDFLAIDRFVRRIRGLTPNGPLRPLAARPR